MNIFDSLRLCQKKRILEKLVPYGLSYGAALKILQVMNFDLSLVNIELVREADRIPYDVINGLSFSIGELSKQETEVLEEYCLTVILK